MAKNEIIVRCFLENTETGEVKAWEDLAEKEITRFREKASERLTENMSRYFAQHPDELKKLVG